MDDADRITPEARTPQRLALLQQLLHIEATSVEAALARSSDHLAAALQCDKIDVMLLDPTRQTLIAVGTSDTPLGRRQRALGLHLQPLANRGRAAAVFATGVPYRHGHVRDDADELIGIRESLGVQSEMIVRLTVAGEHRGVLAAASVHPDAFTETDLRFLETVAEWVATVLHRVELREHVAREEEERTRRIAADELVRTLAHDLRRPLTTIIGYLGLLARDARRNGEARTLRYVDTAREAAEWLNAMVRDLLDAERLERGLFALAPAPFDLVALVRETVAGLQTADSPITVDAPEQLAVVADAAGVRQALQNLVANAQTHTPAGTPIMVGVETATDARRTWAVLTVRDQGPGIPPERMPTLFTRFQRGPESQGLGLGLYLVRGIAEAHGGAVTVESAPGEGTAFRLRLPLAS